MSHAEADAQVREALVRVVAADLALGRGKDRLDRAVLGRALDELKRAPPSG